MDREQTLREALQSRLGNTLIFPVDPPNDAGLFFAEFDGWKALVHPAELAVLTEVLADTDFLLFIEGLVVLINYTFEVLDEGSFTDVEDAILTAQSLTATAIPDTYALLDAVFA